MMQVMTGSVDGGEQKAQEEAGKVRFVLLMSVTPKFQGSLSEIEI